MFWYNVSHGYKQQRTKAGSLMHDDSDLECSDDKYAASLRAIAVSYIGLTSSAFSETSFPHKPQ